MTRHNNRSLLAKRNVRGRAAVHQKLLLRRLGKPRCIIASSGHVFEPPPLNFQLRQNLRSYRGVRDRLDHPPWRLSGFETTIVWVNHFSEWGNGSKRAISYSKNSRECVIRTIFRRKLLIPAFGYNQQVYGRRWSASKIAAERLPESDG